MKKQGKEMRANMLRHKNARIAGIFKDFCTYDGIKTDPDNLWK